MNSSDGVAVQPKGELREGELKIEVLVGKSMEVNISS